VVLEERQHAWQRLGELESSASRESIAAALVAWEEGKLEAGVALEVLRAATNPGKRGTAEEPMTDRARQLLSPTLQGSPADLVEARRWALSGGDRDAGRVVFQTTGDCQRCHDGGGGGHGSGAGPSLSGVASRGAEYVLESMVAPGAEIAAGFGSVRVTLTDGTTLSGLLVSEGEEELALDMGGAAPRRIAESLVASRTEPSTGMPPMGLTLSPEDLRNVHAYVMSLEE
jgi:putative heme-binding domain-containing protein